MEWSGLYPEFFSAKVNLGKEPLCKKMKAMGKQVEFADVGCGYGGLLGNISLIIHNVNNPITRFPSITNFIFNGN